jgi:hypothetical protein
MRVAAPDKKRLEKELDRLCRHLVVILRDKNTCQRCGNPGADGYKIDWSHVHTRRIRSLRWMPWNSKALCAGCHMWWGAYREQSREWFILKFPTRWAFLQAHLQQKHKAPDLVLTKKFLEAEISRSGGPD